MNYYIDVVIQERLKIIRESRKRLLKRIEKQVLIPSTTIKNNLKKECTNFV